MMEVGDGGAGAPGGPGSPKLSSLLSPSLKVQPRRSALAPRSGNYRPEIKGRRFKSVPVSELTKQEELFLGGGFKDLFKRRLEET